MIDKHLKYNVHHVACCCFYKADLSLLSTATVLVKGEHFISQRGPVCLIVKVCFFFLRKNPKIQLHELLRKINNPFSASLCKAQWNKYKEKN